jgi:glycosyltransferase involved in cell wall biosynthesis
MDISVVVPLFNEDESLPELVEWIDRVMSANNFSYEVILIDDGSTDNSWNVVEDIKKGNKNIRGIKFRRNYGKSAALNVGFDSCEGDVVITMDADLQDSPDEIPDLYKMIKKDGMDIVSGWKKKRFDPVSKTIPTKLFNAVTRKISGIKLHDFNCGLKAYKKDVVKNIEVYGEKHRYIPLLAKWEGFTKIGEKVVVHQARKYGKSKFGLERFMNGFLDLLSITFVGKFGKQPMHLFGLVGAMFGFFGFVSLLYLSYCKIFQKMMGIAERPLFFLGILSLILGIQFLMTGFLAELVIKNNTDRTKFKIEKRI